MSAEIFITTFGKDASWLYYSLLSIKKFATGFSGVTVLYPERDKLVCSKVCDEFPNTKQRTFHEFEGRGKVHQMAEACHADDWCPDAEVIFHWDSDCVFTEPVRPEDFFIDGRPTVLFLRYDSLLRLGHEELEQQQIHKDSIQYLLKWREVTERALGFSTPCETMRGFPLVYIRDLYEAVRRHCEAVHSRPFLDYVLDQQNEFPQGFCEYNALGGYAWHHFRDRYHWIDLECQPRLSRKVRQFWSHGGLTRRLPDGRRAVEVLDDILDTCTTTRWQRLQWRVIDSIRTK